MLLNSVNNFYHLLVEVLRNNASIFKNEKHCIWYNIFMIEFKVKGNTFMGSRFFPSTVVFIQGGEPTS